MGNAQNHVEFSKRAVKDLRGLPENARKLARKKLKGLEPIPPLANLDIKPVEGHRPWLRMRVGDYRVLFRVLSRAEMDLLVMRRGALAGETGYLVARVVDRAELERAVDTLDLTANG